MLELLVVLGIVAVVLGTAVVGLNGLVTQASLEMAVNELRQNMRKAKTMAISHNQDCLMVFNASNSGSYRACLGGDVDCSSGQNMVLQQSFEDYPGVSMREASFDAGENRVVFTPEGTIEGYPGGLGAGSVYFSDEGGRTLRVVFPPFDNNIRVEKE